MAILQISGLLPYSPWQNIVSNRREGKEAPVRERDRSILGGCPRIVISSDSEKSRSFHHHEFARFLSPLRSVRNDRTVFSNSLLVAVVVGGSIVAIIG
jgi:hypothetical protein